MIRFVAVALIVILFLILSIPILLYERFLKKKDPEKQMHQSLAVVQFMFRLILKVSGVQVTVEGRENIPRDKAVLYVGNHRSYFDIVLTYARCPGRTGYIATKEMEKIPLLSQWMKFLYCLFLARKDIKQ